MLKDVKFIVLSHYDFLNKDNQQIKGSKIVLTTGGNVKLELSTDNSDVFNLDILTTYHCDLFVNDKLKIDIANIRK